MYKRHETGKSGERIANEYFRKMGYNIVCQNYRCRMGEIDIIAEDDEELVFVEVKTRTRLDFGLPSEAVNKRKKEHIFSVAKFFLRQNNLENAFCRFDVVEIYMNEKRTKINHIKNCIFNKPHKTK